MPDTKLENRILELEGKIDALTVVLLSIPASLQSVEPRALQHAVLSGLDFAVLAEMPLPEEVRDTAFLRELKKISASMTESLEPDQT